MKKSFNLFTKIVFTIFCIFFSYSNVFAQSKAQEIDKRKNYPDIKEFSKLHISGFAKVIVEYSKNYSLKIEANEKIQRQLEVVSQIGELFILTDIRNFNKHKITSYNIKQKPNNGLKLKKTEFNGIISIIETQEGNYLVQNNKIYQTKATNIRDLITIYIETPDIEHITLDGNIQLILKENNHKEEKNNKKRNLKIESNLESSIEISNLNLNTFEINLFKNSKLDINHLKTNSLDIKASGLSKINIANLEVKNNSNLFLKETSISNIKEFKSKEFHLIVEDDSKAEFHDIIIEDNLIFSLKNNGMIQIAKLETVNMLINAMANGEIKIDSGKTIYKTKINCSGNSIIKMSEIPIKEAEIYSTGSGSAHLKVIDKLSKTLKNNDFNLIIEGDPEIIDSHIKKEQKIKKLKKPKKLKKKKKKRKKRLKK